VLLSKNYQKDEIVCFKMVNGDEIVAKVIEDKSPNGWIVQRPCTLIPGPQGIGLIQSLFGADINKEVELKSEHVMMNAPVVKQLEDHYIQTTTGIQTISKGPIIV